jgi:hypothetical protein
MLDTPGRHKETTKLKLHALDGFCGTIEAQYNPHEIQVDKTVPWEDGAPVDSPLTPVAFKPRTITLELFLDCYEAGPHASLKAELDVLTRMTLPIDADMFSDDALRPPLLVLQQGPFADDLRCVMESLSIKVTMFGKFNQPVRATCSIRLREVSITRDGVLWNAPPGATRALVSRIADGVRALLKYHLPGR